MTDPNLSVIKSEGGAVAPAQILTVEQVFRAVIEQDINPEKVAVMKELLAMSAEREFNTAFVKLQSELPVIVAMTVIPNRGKYARFEDVMDKISKHLAANGFSVSFSQDFKENRTVETCTLRHAGGHSQSNSFAVRTTGGRSDSDAQADCKASTTAKRNALLNCLNIVVRQDCLTSEQDAGMEGDPDKLITKEQAFELERRCGEVNANVPAFLEFAKAKTFSGIQADRYAELDTMLGRKEKSSK